MPNETSQVTIINPRPSKPPSLWINMLTLIALFGLIVGAKQLSNKWLSKAPPPEDKEKQIVMEDLESEKPLAESTAVEMSQAEEAKPITPQAEEAKPDEGRGTRDGGPSSAKASEGKLVTRDQKQKRRTSNVVHRTNKSPYAEPDPYTDGGPMDLDRQENQKSQQTKASAPQRETVTATPPTPLDERDRFIPFESK